MKKSYQKIIQHLQHYLEEKGLAGLTLSISDLDGYTLFTQGEKLNVTSVALLAGGYSGARQISEMFSEKGSGGSPSLNVKNGDHLLFIRSFNHGEKDLIMCANIDGSHIQARVKMYLDLLVDQLEGIKPEERLVPSINIKNDTNPTKSQVDPSSEQLFEDITDQEVDKLFAGF